MFELERKCVREREQERQRGKRESTPARLVKVTLPIAQYVIPTGTGV